MVVGELNEGAALIEQALTLNPNLALSWNLGGWVRLWLNQPDAAIDHFARAMRLSPLDVGFHGAETGTAFAHLRARRYEEASLWAEKALRDQPRSADAAQAVALSSALVGDLEKAKEAIRRLLEDHQIGAYLLLSFRKSCRQKLKLVLLISSGERGCPTEFPLNPQDLPVVAQT